jgi:predicted nucleic acid-binding protein
LTRYTALLDACVLVPITLADTLLRVAERELYRPLWSERILAEAAYAVREVHADLPVEVVAKRFAAMRAAFEDAAVEGWEALGASLSLPDPDDRHVVAAALCGHADAIVTANLRDFPDEALAPLGMAAVDPDDFLLDQLDLAAPTRAGHVRVRARPAADRVGERVEDTGLRDHDRTHGWARGRDQDRTPLADEATEPERDVQPAAAVDVYLPADALGTEHEREASAGRLHRPVASDDRARLRRER